MRALHFVRNFVYTGGKVGELFSCLYLNFFQISSKIFWLHIFLHFLKTLCFHSIKNYESPLKTQTSAQSSSIFMMFKKVKMTIKMQ